MATYAAHSRQASIDLSLELERQLDQEEDGDAHAGASPEPTSLDPDVLASIVIQQRASLADVTHERDELAAALAKAYMVQSELQTQVSELTSVLEEEQSRTATLEGQLAEAKQKSIDDAESISMLRAKVEESRRGVMRLQTENRRASQFQPLATPDSWRSSQFQPLAAPENRRASLFQPLPLDLSSASTTSGGGRTPGFSTFSKRASIISTSAPRSPTFLAHRRASSISDPGLSPESADSDHHVVSFAYGPVIVVPETPTVPESPTAPRAYFELPDPQALSPAHAGAPSQSPLITVEELGRLRAELASLRRDLTEAREAREASEICLRALRDFIGDNTQGDDEPGKEARALKGLSLPPLPTDTEVEEEEIEEKLPVEEKKTGWGIKLWRSSTAVPPAPQLRKVSPPDVSQPPTSRTVDEDASTDRPTLPDRTSSSTVPGAGNTQPASPPPTTAAPAPPKFMKKFSLFSSSVTPTTQRDDPPVRAAAEQSPQPAPVCVAPQLSETDSLGSHDSNEPVSPPDHEAAVTAHKALPVGDGTPTSSSDDRFAIAA